MRLFFWRAGEEESTARQDEVSEALADSKKKEFRMLERVALKTHDPQAIKLAREREEEYRRLTAEDALASWMEGMGYETVGGPGDERGGA